MLTQLMMQSTVALTGYLEKKCPHLLTLTDDGGFVSFETPEEPLTVLLPTVSRTSNIAPYSAVDNLTYSLGCTPPTDERGDTPERHAAFLRMMQHHADTLGESDAVAPKAFLRFLQREDRPALIPVGVTSEQVQELLDMELPPFSGKLSAKEKSSLDKGLSTLDIDPVALARWQHCIRETLSQHPSKCPTILPVAGGFKDLLLVRVVGHDDGWIQSQRVQDYHAAHTGGKRAGTCCVTGKANQPLVEKTGSVGMASLISFNPVELYGYGQKKYGTSPISRDADTRVHSGLGHLLSAVSVSVFDFRMMLFRDDRSHEADFLKSVLKGSDKDVPALSERPCHFLMMKKDGHVWRILEWREDMPLGPLIQMAKNLSRTDAPGNNGLHSLVESLSEGPSQLGIFRDLLRQALTAKPLSLTTQRKIRGLFSHDRRATILRNLIRKDPMTTPSKLTPAQSAVYQLGRWVARQENGEYWYQTTNGRDTKTLWSRHARDLQANPHRAYVLIAERKDKVKSTAKDLVMGAPETLKSTQGREMKSYMQEVPDRLSYKLKAMLIEGYFNQTYELRAASAAKKAAEAAETENI